MLNILGRTSSINVRKVLWTCAELDLPFEHENWGTGFQSTSDEAFLQMNPNAMVPEIKDDGFVLWESNTIIRYLRGYTDGKRDFAVFKSLADIERGFRVLKSEIEIEPIYHRLPNRIRAHAAICFMALIPYRVMPTYPTARWNDQACARRCPVRTAPNPASSDHIWAPLRRYGVKFIERI